MTRYTVERYITETEEVYWTVEEDGIVVFESRFLEDAEDLADEWNRRAG